MERQCQVLIVGAGITGLTTARELLKRGAEDLLIIEKEKSLGAHASGRNSGVLHAGIYYSPGTNKARFCVEGNRLMKEYCRERRLTLEESGKVIVAGDADKLEGIEELKRRADSCGAESRIIGDKELSEIEPYAVRNGKALYSPDTAVISPLEILESLKDELIESGKVKINFSTSFKDVSGSTTAVTTRGDIKFERFVNAAGAFADKVARHFGVGDRYRILPFKGTYKKLSPGASHLVRSNIYPVPDLRNPFLGVHFTRGADGNVYLGPTAIPALGREEYGFLDDISKETISILLRDSVLFFTNEAFRTAAVGEIRKYASGYLYKEARKLVPELKADDLIFSPKTGIRPQLVDWSSKELVMDFLVLREADSIHILNAISPAFTCSMAFAKYTVDKLLY
jgi:(S)-2-hydroxyglutarate dehydrogenase